MIGLILIFSIMSLIEPMAVNKTGSLLNPRQCCGTCFLFGCPAGLCCSQYGYCGNTPEHCQGAITQGDCQTRGCPNGLCCSKYGFCGNTPEHCDNTPISNGNCQQTGCPTGQCCSVHGFCGTTPQHCGNVDPNIGQGNCRQTGCAPGLCCSRFGYCGNTVDHCLGSNVGTIGCSGCGGGVVVNCANGCSGKK